MQEIFDELLYNGALVWLDDVLGFATDEEELMAILERILQLCDERGLKLNPEKCEFFKKKEVHRCGRIINEERVRHDPERIRALREMPGPETAKDLQQLICAANWMWTSIPGYNVLTRRLIDLLEEAYARAGGRTTQKVSRVRLDQLGWGLCNQEALHKCKQALGEAVRLVHMDPDKDLNVFTDASKGHWGAVVAQVSQEQARRRWQSKNINRSCS